MVISAKGFFVFPQRILHEVIKGVILENTRFLLRLIDPHSMKLFSNEGIYLNSLFKT